jgi:hypothetical protein
VVLILFVYGDDDIGRIPYYAWVLLDDFPRKSANGHAVRHVQIKRALPDSLSIAGEQP